MKDVNDHGCSSELPETDERLAVFAEQRKERGFDDTETWSLDYAIAKFAIPRLKRFKELHICHPPNITMEEWDEKIQDMIDGFEEVVKDGTGGMEVDYDKMDKGLDTFREYYRDLWW